MKNFLIFAALGALCTTGPALAQSSHSKSGKIHPKSEHGRSADNRDREQTRENRDKRDTRSSNRWDSRSAAYNGDGRGYWSEGRYFRDGRLYGTSCPRGLSKKNNGCLPPGHAKARWAVGQRLPNAYRDDYLPSAYRDRYTNGTYRYADGYVYQVDPKTYVIKQVISALLR